MTRVAIALVLGVLLGAVATVWLAPSSVTAPQREAWPPAVTAAAPSEPPATPPAAREASPDFYRRLADADPAELESLITRAAAGAPSTDRELALAVLFKRYAALDAVRAVRLARETRVRGAALGAAYGAWARAAPEQVLAALSTVGDADDAADVALAVIAALGDDATAVRRVGAVLAAREREASGGPVALPPMLTPAATVSLAARSALALTAQRFADLDARRALLVAREVDDERVRLAFEAAALRSLARVAPEEAFARLAEADASSLQPAVLSGTLLELARADPERVLRAAENLPTDVRRGAEFTALQQLAERDPLAAARRLDGMSLGPERQMFLQIVARAYGKRDAAAALAWARERSNEPMLVSAVLGGVAEDDPSRALDLALELPSPMERMRAVQMVAAASARDDATAEAMANRLLNVDDPQMREMVASTVTSMWASRSPERAMQWLLANSRDASPNAFQQVGQQLAMRDPQGAIGYTAQIPSAAREAWAHGVAQGYAQNDAPGAIDWLGRFRGEAWYGRAASAVAMTVAQRDGAAAARLLDELDAAPGGDRSPQLITTIAMSWANRDPAAAADWSLARATEQERDMAIRSVVGSWVAQDVDAARQWTLRQPRGPARDAALTTVLMASVLQTAGTVDASLLGAFASPQAQQSAVLQVVQGLAFSDAAKARAIADAHLDAPLRAQAEAMIDAAGRRQSGPPINIGIQSVVPAQRVAPMLPPRRP